MNLSEIRIDRSALLYNLKALRTCIDKQTKVAAVVKGNAYGHGLPEVVKSLEDEVAYFQVDDLQELAELRNQSNRAALLLGYVSPSELEAALELGCELGVFDETYVSHVGEACRKWKRSARVHVKIDALLGRLGILPSRLPEMFEELDRWPELEPVALYAHFANIEDTTDLTHAQEQKDLLLQCVAWAQSKGRAIPFHISATSGAMAIEGSEAGAICRLGIGLYGMYPSTPLSRTHSELQLRPVMTWVSHLAQVKELPARHPVGYGLTYVTSACTRIGIVPQGYSDGYDRGLSNSGEVLVAGKRCPVLGRIAMNMFAVDLQRVPEAQAGDEVVLLGSQGQDRISAEEVAAKIGTINYEITSRVSPLLPRELNP